MFTLPDEIETAAPQPPDLLTPQASAVTQNTICIVVRKGRFGTRRKASTADVKVQSDKALLSLSKNILESPELKKVQQADGEIARYLKDQCLKSMFKGGVYLIPLGSIEEVNDALHAFAARRQQLVEEAVKTYDTRTTETSARLEVLHDPGDYPSKERFAQRFYFEWQFVTWETPTRLRAIRPALFQVEREKAAAKLAAVADECRSAMRAGLKGLVDHMVDRLTPDPSGKKKRFNKRTVENFHEFFRMFELKNVTDDTELAAVVTKAKQVMAGVDVQGLKKDEAIRNALQLQFENLKLELTPLTEEYGDRDIDLDDSDDDADA
jgi:hypothetical protein